MGVRGAELETLLSGARPDGVTQSGNQVREIFAQCACPAADGGLSKVFGLAVLNPPAAEAPEVTVPSGPSMPGLG